MLLINDEELLYSADELDFQSKIRELIETEISPIVEDIENKSIDYREFFRKLGSSGLSGLLIPKKYGGSEKPFFTAMYFGNVYSTSRHLSIVLCTLL